MTQQAALPILPTGACYNLTMAPVIFFLFSGLLLASPTCAQRRRKPAVPESPIDKIGVQANFDPNLFAGKWFLVGVASRCSYLSENSHRLEATNMVVSVVADTTSSKSLLVGTFRPMDGICWNIKQIYFSTKTPGRYLLKGRGNPTDMVVGETDYHSYAIVYYQKFRKIAAKLYGRTIRVSDAITAKFEERVVSVGLNEDFTYYFPTYGFCDSADQFHILDDTKYGGPP